MALNLGDIKKKKGILPEKAVATPIDVPLTARMKVPFDLRLDQPTAENVKPADVSETQTSDTQPDALITPTIDQTPLVTSVAPTEAIALDATGAPQNPSVVAPSIGIDHAEFSDLKASNKLSTNKAPDKHQLGINKASIRHQEVNPDAHMIHREPNKATIEHHLSINKAPVRQELSTSKESVLVLGEKAAQLGINKASVKHQKKVNKAGSKASVEHQLGTNKAPNLRGGFTDLVGDEKSFIELIFVQLEHSLSMETNKIPTEQLATDLGKTGNRIRTLIQRLVEKQVLIVAASARGKASWRRFSLPENVIQEIKLQRTIRHQLSSNWAGDKAGNKASEVPYSNSSLNKDLNTTITTAINFSERIEIPTDLIRTGIKLANIISHVKTEEDLERINESLQAYAFDFHVKGIIKTAVFYGAIKNGQYYHSDAYTQEMEKERQKQAMAAKARAEIKQFQIQIQTPSKSKAEEEFEKKYDEAFAQTILNKMPQASQNTIKLLAANGIYFAPFKEALKNYFVQIREKELNTEHQAKIETDQGRG